MAMDTVLANGNEAVVAFLDAAGAFDATSHKWIDVALKRAFGDDLSDCAGNDQDDDDQDKGDATSAQTDDLDTPLKTDCSTRKLRRLADWPRSAVRFIYCRLKPCDDACAHARSFASTWALPTNSRATGVFSPRRIRRSNVARAQTNSRITPIRARNEKGAY